jgi:hypothetical protein
MMLNSARNFSGKTVSPASQRARSGKDRTLWHQIAEFQEKRLLESKAARRAFMGEQFCGTEKIKIPA